MCFEWYSRVSLLTLRDQGILGELCHPQSQVKCQVNQINSE